VEQIGETEFNPTSDLPGSGGEATFRFRSIRTGSDLLRLQYSRSFEPNAPPTRTFEVNVIVED
jgi:predicted secreted protein